MKKTKQTMLTAALLSAALAMQGELNYLSDSASAVTKAPEPADNSTRLMAVVYGPPPAKSTTASETTSETTEETKLSETESAPVTEPTDEYTPPKFNITVPVYGCPVTGDVNNDGKINIVDYTVLKNIVSGEHYELVGADLNFDGTIDAEDLKMFEHFFFGLTSDPSEKADVPETKPVTTTVTEPKPTPSPYNDPAEAMTTTVTEPRTMGSVYGPPPAYYSKN